MRFIFKGVVAVLALYWVGRHLIPRVEDPRSEDQIKAEHRVLVAYLLGRPPEWFVPPDS